MLYGKLCNAFKISFCYNYYIVTFLVSGLVWYLGEAGYPSVFSAC